MQYIPDEDVSEIVAIPQPADAIVDAPGAANAIHVAPEPLIVNPELVTGNAIVETTSTPTPTPQ